VGKACEQCDGDREELHEHSLVGEQGFESSYRLVWSDCGGTLPRDDY